MAGCRPAARPTWRFAPYTTANPGATTPATFHPPSIAELDEAIFSTDPNLRMSLYHEVQATILRDAPVLFLAYSLDLTYGYRAEMARSKSYSTEIVDLRSVFRHDPP